ncbi:MAG: glutaminyl-peptide cyclotransferase [Flammeovirgaceae bacterium]
MNGIASDSISTRIFMTGTTWHKIYELKIRM